MSYKQFLNYRRHLKSFIDGTITGILDGVGEWYDYYDQDPITYFNWQTTPTVQPNEPGESCTKMFYYGVDDEKNGLGDGPCQAVTGDECYFTVSFYGSISRSFF